MVMKLKFLRSSVDQRIDAVCVQTCPTGNVEEYRETREEI
jgi:hypothetical protein